MAMAAVQAAAKALKNVAVDRWLFTVVAIAMLAISLVGFVPAIVHLEGRRAPLSLLAAGHGVVFFVWLLVFLVQSRLIATRHVAWHRRLGIAAVFVLLLMIPLDYMATVAMGRRGFDLNGDLRIDARSHDKYIEPLTGAVFPLTDLLIRLTASQGALRTCAASQVRIVTRYSGSIVPSSPFVVRRIPWSTFGNTRMVKSPWPLWVRTRRMTSTLFCTGINRSWPPNKNRAGTRNACSAGTGS